MTQRSGQESCPSLVQHHKKGRGKEEKIGRLKYNQFLLKRVLTEIKEVREVQRVILNGLKAAGYFHFDVPMLQKLACEDEVDVEILQQLFESGRGGMFPKDVAKSLLQYDLARWHVSRRAVRMNKRLEHETGERLFEKRGLKWALTRFAFEVFGSTKDEVKEEAKDAW